MPFEAQNALRGESSAFDALDKSAARLKTLRAAVPGSGDAANFEQAERRRDHGCGGARPAVEAIQASNQEVRELAPKLLSELGDLGSSVGVQKLEGMSRYLERFELTVQRIQQDLNGLGSGVSDAGPSAQRLADSLEFLNQVIRGTVGRGVGHCHPEGDRCGSRAAIENRGAAESAIQRQRAQGDRRRRCAVQGASRRPRLARTRQHSDRRVGRAPRRALNPARSYKPWILVLLGLAAVLFGGAGLDVFEDRQHAAHQRAAGARK